MNEKTVFYCWQSDSPNSTNRGFIGECLEKAIEELNSQEQTALKMVAADRDVLGNQDITNLVFNHIDKCSAFVADISFINLESTDRLTPNPNVMAEWGRATKSIDDKRTICVFNKATGLRDKLPFHLNHRTMICYHLEKGQPKEDVRRELIKDLKKGLRAVLQLPHTMLDLQFQEGSTLIVFDNEVVKITESPEPEPVALSHQYTHEGWVVRANGIQLPSTASILHRPDPQYRSKMQIWKKYTQFVKPIVFILKNQGNTLLTNVRLDATVETKPHVLLEKLPERPEKHDMLSVGLLNHNMTSIWGSPQIEDNNISISFGGIHGIQPKDTITSEPFFLGANNSKVRIIGKLFMNQNDPVEINMLVEFRTTEREITLEEAEL